MAMRRSWYKASKYKELLEQEALSDGSQIAVRETPDFKRKDLVTGEDQEFPDARTITRVYPTGYIQRVVYRLRPDGSAHYLQIDPGPEAHDKRTVEERAKAMDEALSNGEFRVNFRGAIPGQGISNIYDDATRKTYATSAQFEDEYDRMQLSRCMRSDHSTMHRNDGMDEVYSGRDAGPVQHFDGRPGVSPPPARRP